MAKGASKKISSNNASSLRLLLYGFVITNALQLLLLFTPLLSSLRYRRSSTWTWDLVRYVLTEAVAAGIALVMRDMASKGEDLDAQGLTALMWDVVFVTWFIHAGTALIWRRLWWIYAVVSAKSNASQSWALSTKPQSRTDPYNHSPSTKDPPLRPLPGLHQTRRPFCLQRTRPNRSNHLESLRRRKWGGWGSIQQWLSASSE